MPTIFLLLGLTIIYYVVLFQVDKRKKAAFQKAAQQAIGETEAFPTPPTIDVFGTINEPINPSTPLVDNQIITQTIKATEAAYLKSDLEKMVMEVQAEQTLETPTIKVPSNAKELNQGMLDEKESNEKEIDEAQLAKMVAKISNRKS